MPKNITIGTIYVPGWGGPATEGYRLFHIMQQEGIPVSFINIIPQDLLQFFREKFGDPPGNPQNLANVYDCVVEHPLAPDRTPVNLARLLKMLSPDVIVGKMWRAAFLLKRAAPATPLIFLPSGCERLKMYIRQGSVKDFLSLRHCDLPATPLTDASLIENEAVRCSDLVIVHSEIMHTLYRDFFPFLNGRLHPEVLWYADWILREASLYSEYRMPFEQRDIDVLFIANDWNRPEKKFGMVRRIVSGCPGLSIHVAGELNEELSGAIAHGLIAKRQHYYSLLGRTKCVVSPSVFDAAPNILFEASAMECNTVCSRNCGNWKLSNQNLVVDSFSPKNFIDKIHLASLRKFDDNLNLFVRNNSYHKLRDLILNYT